MDDNRRLRIVGEEDPGRKAERFIRSADDEVVACRAWGHQFPGLDFGEEGNLLHGVEVQPLRAGVFQLTFPCQRCGKERTLTTAPHGLVDGNARYRYRDPRGLRYAAPEGARRTAPREWKAEDLARKLRVLKKAAGKVRAS